MIRELKHEVDISQLDTRRDAMNAYILACLYREVGQSEEYLKYMIFSAMADVRTANRDIASLEELSKALFESGDIDHSYTYINYCLQLAQLYRNRVRVVGISEVQDAIHKAYQERNRRQEERLHSFLVLVSILSVVLLGAICYIYVQMKSLSRSRARLNEMNQLLNKHIDELSQAHTRLAEINGEFAVGKSSVKGSQQSVARVELCEGRVYRLRICYCSNYISKLDEFRKNVESTN
mgnify:CR=1 FL=1